MPSRDVNAATRLAEASYRRDKFQCLHLCNNVINDVITLYTS